VTRCVVGVIGHVDHGKTALVRALTGQETDRLPEEKARGISIALGFAHFSVGDATVDLIDMPGHERFVRTMIAGATGIDAVLLTVAANESVRPQTVEHMQIAQLLGIERALVAVTKCDLVSQDEAALAAAEAVELLAHCGIGEVSEPVLTSAKRGLGIDQLRMALAGEAGRQPLHASDGIAFMPIDRAFSMSGHGPVVTGTLRGGAIAVGDALALLPATREVRVRSIQVHGQRVDAATPGQRVAINLRGVQQVDLDRGMALATPDLLETSEWLTVSLRVLPDAPELKNGARVKALFGTQEVAARLRLLDCDVAGPGHAALAQLRLAEDAALPAGEHVILRRASPAGTLGGGRVLEPIARRLKRHHPPVLDRLAMLRDGELETIVRAELAAMADEGTTMAHLARLAGWGLPRLEEELASQPVIIQRDGRILPKSAQERRKLTARRDPGASERDARLSEQLAERLRQAGLTPPLPKEVITDPLIDRVADRLRRDGVLLRCTDRDKDKTLLFHRDAVAEACRVLAPLLEASEQGLLVSEIAKALGISRKFCMPLLDHLDTTRFTRRVGDRRVKG